MKTYFLFFIALIAQHTAQALEVFACEPEWAALTKEIAGANANVFVATSAMQDVHQIEARPSLIAKMRRADVVVCTGAELEIGWLPQLMTQASNSKLSDRNRVFYAAEQVPLLDKPTQLDRSSGDVHAAGNPHVHLDPQRMLTIAQQLTQRLALIDSEHAADYQKNAAQFASLWQTAMQKWQLQAKPLQGKSIIVSHDNLRYLAQWLGLNVVARLEPRPGLPPTTAHLAEVLKLTQAQTVFAIVQAAYEDPKSGAWLAARTNVPHIIVPYTVGGASQTDTLTMMMDKTVQVLIEAKE